MNEEKVQRLLRRLCPLYEQLDLRVNSIGELLSVTVPLNDVTGNHLGGVHAAAQWAAAESLGGIAYAAHPELGRGWVAVRSVNIDFSSVARGDVCAEATFGAAEVSQLARQLGERGRADYDLLITLSTSSGLVGQANGSYHIRLTDH